MVSKATGASYPAVSDRIVKESPLPLPPIEDQRRIAAILDQADLVHDNAKQAASILRNLPRERLRRLVAAGARMRELGEYLTFLTSGSRGWARHYTTSGDIFIRIQNVQDARLDLSDVAYVDAPDNAEARRTRVQAGDVLLSITADLGRTAVIPDSLGVAYVNQHLAVLRLQGVNPTFVAHFLRSTQGNAQLMKRNRAAVKAGLNFDDIRSVEIPVIEARSQSEFACFVAQVEGQAGLSNQRIAELVALRESLQSRAFSGRL